MPTEPLSLPPKALLWDIDGTLIDTTTLVAESLDHVYRKFFGRSAPMEEIRAIIGIPLATQVSYLGDPADFGIDPKAMETEFIRYWEENLHHERVIPEAVACLKRGHAMGIPTALVTSKNREEIRNTLPRIGVLECVDLIISADDVSRPKPDPEGVLKALGSFAVEPGDALFIGDTVHDLRAGQAAGVPVCGVLWGAGTRTALAGLAPELLCESPSALAALIGLG